MKRRITLPLIAAALFAFIIVGCTGLTEEAVLPQEPDTERELTLEEKRAKFNELLATRAGTYGEIVEITVHPGRFKLTLNGWHENSTAPYLDHMIMSWNSNLIFEETTKFQTEIDVNFTADDIVYIIGDTDITIATMLEGSAIEDVKYYNSAIRMIGIRDVNAMGTLDLGDIPSLTYLSFFNITPSSLEFPNFANLEHISFKTVLMADGPVVDLSASTKLIYIDIGDYKHITTFPYSIIYHPAILPATANSLRILRFGHIDISSVDFTNYPNLETLFVREFPLNYADLSQSIKLTSITLNAGANQIVLPDPQTPFTGYYDLGVNNLTSIDMTKLRYGTYIDVSDNNLTSLDLSQNGPLKTLICHSNPITSLDLSALVNLETLDISGTSIPNGALLVALRNIADRNGKTAGKLRMTNPSQAVITLLDPKNWELY